MISTTFQSNNSTHLETLLTGGQVAMILNVSRSYAFLLMQRGVIPTVRMGRSVRVRPADLAQFIQQNHSNGSADGKP